MKRGVRSVLVGFTTASASAGDVYSVVSNTFYQGLKPIESDD